jgi:hypothetical protein
MIDGLLAINVMKAILQHDPWGAQQTLRWVSQVDKGHGRRQPSQTRAPRSLWGTAGSAHTMGYYQDSRCWAASASFWPSAVQTLPHSWCGCCA